MPYTRLTLCYYSGTGNSYRVAQWLAEAGQGQGVPARVLPLAQDAALPEVAPGELLGVLLPTHGFTAPWYVLRRVAALPRGRADAFVLATRAGVKLGPLFLPGMEGTAACLVGGLLRWRGYRLRGVLGLDMPSNWTALHPGFGVAAAQAIVARARPRAEAFLGWLLAGARVFGWASGLCLLLGLLLAPVSLLYLLKGRFFLGKLFFANTRCNGCGICAANCPVQAIRMWGRRQPRPYWTFACESCMRCMNYCPQVAVEAGHSWAVLAWYLSAIPAAMWGFNALAWQVPAPLVWLAQYVFFLAALALAYLVFHLATRWAPLNRLFAWTTLTHWYRRYHEPGTALGDLRPPRDPGAR